MSALRTSMLCKGCGGTVGDHLAPDQGGCPGHFVIDGVEMIPSGHRDKLRAEVERLRADANARAVEELTKLREQARAAGANSWVGPVWLALWCHNRIEELSKPAAKESQYRLMIQTCPPKPAVPNGCVVDPYSSLCCDRGTKSCIEEHNGEESAAMVETKPEEPDWTVTLAAQAKKVLLGPAGPAHLACSLLVKVVEGLCHLGREVRRGGKS